MAKNGNLAAAKAAQEDEFYTQYEDIANELPRYREQMRGKRILCPCDWDESLDELLVYASEDYVAGGLFSAGGSVKTVGTYRVGGHVEKDLDLVKCNFVKFLIAHAEAYGIASVSVSGYNPATGEGVRFQDIDYSKYDLVITNPPFSKMREFIDTMFDNGMLFLVIARMTHAKAKGIFPRIVRGEMWLGYHSGEMAFKVPAYAQPKKTRFWVDEDGQKWQSIGNACWLTNLDVTYRHDRMILTDEYDPERHLRYTNFDGIDARSIEEIPYDWPGNIGVTITLLSRYNPEQFEIVGLGEGDLAKEIGVTRNHEGRTKLEVQNPDGTYRRPFARIVVRNREPRQRHE